MPSSLRVDTVVRTTGLLLCAALGIAQEFPLSPKLIAFLLGFALVTVLSSSVPSDATSQRLAGVIEGALWAGGVLATGGNHSPLLPYLLAPAFVGGFMLGIEGALPPVSVAGVGLLSAARVVDPRMGSDVLASGAEWVAVAVLVGLLAAWIHRLQLQRVGPEDQYVAAYRLVGQLRTVARHLSVGLDKVALADAILRDIQTRGLEVVSGAVLARTSGERLAVLATTGARRTEWDLDLHRDSALSDAWASQTVQARPGTLAGESGGSYLVIPLVVGLGTIGVIVIEVDSPELPSVPTLRDLQKAVTGSALRLETALLFDELREVATVEERRRLGREIHDGIAQDLAAMGYLLDNLMRETSRSQTSAAALAEPLAQLRAELRRVIGELRSSLFELRTEVDQHGGVGGALTEYVRAVGTASAMTVHLTLDESPHRLPADTEAELLRIAQEAITNARKHAKADNLWVACSIDPPRARLVVADDGLGVTSKGEDDSFGMEIMRERAARLRAEFSVSPREPTGTVVTCRVGPVLEGRLDRPEEVSRADDGLAGRRP